LGARNADSYHSSILIPSPGDPLVPCSKCKTPRPTPKNPARCFCGGKISDEEVVKPLTGADKALANIAAKKDKAQAKTIKYSTNFDAHIFDGEADGTTHKGLHSLVRRLATEKDKLKVKKIDTDAETGAYSAWVRLPGYTAYKASTFFPDKWTEDDVLGAIEQAYQAYRVKKGAAKTMIAGAGLKWAGFVTVKDVNIWIGGLGDGDALTGIATAFPAVNGNFVDLAKLVVPKD
jgi:Bacterial EndoU nuclease